MTDGWSVKGNGELAAREGDVAERQHHLARRRGVTDARPAKARHTLEVAVAGDEIHRDRIALARDGERSRLAHLVDQRFQVRSGDIAEVEPAENGVCEPEHANAEAVAAGRGHVLDEAEPRQGTELA